MDAISKYIAAHSNGRSHPITGAEIGKAMSINGIEVRRRINVARTNGDPICANGRGYYIAQSRSEIIQTIESLEGRIAIMNNAKEGLERCLSSHYQTEE